jgi:DNA-binding NarL/FixJ family response regulator
MESTVLIVDDDPQFRRIAAELLAVRGYRVVGEAGSAAEGLALASALNPDAVLLDSSCRMAMGFRSPRASARTAGRVCC